LRLCSYCVTCNVRFSCAILFNAQCLLAQHKYSCPPACQLCTHENRCLLCVIGDACVADAARCGGVPAAQVQSSRQRGRSISFSFGHNSQLTVTFICILNWHTLICCNFSLLSIVPIVFPSETKPLMYCVLTNR